MFQMSYTVMHRPPRKASRGGEKHVPVLLDDASTGVSRLDRCGRGRRGANGGIWRPVAPLLRHGLRRTGDNRPRTDLRRCGRSGNTGAGRVPLSGGGGMAGGEVVAADWVISAADAHATVYGLLGGKYVDEITERTFRTSTPFASYLQVSFGVARDLSSQPGFVTRVSVAADHALDRAATSNLLCRDRRGRRPHRSGIDRDRGGSG
jgi:hypothetical protein